MKTIYSIICAICVMCGFSACSDDHTGSIDVKGSCLVEKFVLNGEDFYAEVITLKDGRYMVLPFGFISKWASLDYIEKEFGENVVDKKTRKLKKEIILDNLNNLGTIITGFYVNPENIKKVVGH